MINITIHEGNPAINIKTYASISSATLPKEDWDKDFTHDWIEKNLSSEAMEFWHNETARNEVEYLIQEGKRIFDDVDYSPSIWQCGRSGGWLEVTDLPEPEDWDKDLIGAWQDFEKLCKSVVESFPDTVVDMIYINGWETRNDEEDKIEDIWDEVLAHFRAPVPDWDEILLLDRFKLDCPLLVAKIEGKD